MAQEQPVMIKPNNLEYFYEEKETSERVDNYHRYLNILWQIAATSTAIFAVFAFVRHNKEQQEIWDTAEQVVSQVEKRGGRTGIRDDGSVVIEIDGKVVDVIPSIEKKNLQQAKDRLKQMDINDCLRDAIMYLVQNKKDNKTVSDFDFYNEHIKPGMI